MIPLTPDDIRGYLEGYQITQSILSDSWIQDKIDNSVVPMVEKWTRMSFQGEKEITEYYSGTGENVLVLNRRPVNAIKHITYVTATNLDSAFAISSIELIQAEGLLKSRVNLEYTYQQRVPIFSKGNKNIKITYTYGSATPPAEVLTAIKLLVAEKCLGHVANRTGGGDLTVQSFGRSYGGHSKFTNERKDMIVEAMNLLSPYMTGVVGG